MYLEHKNKIMLVLLILVGQCVTKERISVIYLYMFSSILDKRDYADKNTTGSYDTLSISLIHYDVFIS